MVRKVYTNFRKDYCAIVKCLENTKTEMRAGNSKERQKAADAEKLMNSICNIKFVLTLSGIIDIYDKYGELITIVQKVNSLPHERFDAFIHVCDKMKTMSKKINHEDCDVTDGKSCSWATYHGDLKKLNEVGEYMGVPIVDHHGEACPITTRSLGRTRRAIANQAENVQDKVSKQITILIKRLENDLHGEVY